MMPPRARPFDRDGLFERVWPFAIVGTFAIGVDALDYGRHDPGPALFGVVLIAAAMIVALVTPWRRLPRSADIAPPVLFILGIALVRHSAGGSESGIVSLLALPIVWVALYADRAQVILVLVVAMSALAAPVLVIGAPTYPPEEWQRVAVNSGIGLLIGLTVHRLVDRNRGHVAEETARAGVLARHEQHLRAIHESAHDAIVTLEPSGMIVDVNPAAVAMFRAEEEGQLLGRDLIATLATEAERDFLRQGMARLTVEQDATTSRRFRTELVRFDGEVFPAEVSVGVVASEGSYLVHAFARDISERVRADAAAAQHREDLAGLLAVAREMVAPTSAGSLRTTICETALSLSKATMAVLVEPMGDELVTTAAAGQSTPIDRIPRDGRTTITATVYATGETAFLGRLSDDPRVARLVASTGVGAGYWQPLRAAGDVVGVLLVLWADEKDSLDPRTESLLRLLASQAEVALELGALVARLEDQALTDGLTNVANRRAFDEALTAELRRAGRSGRPLALVMLDIDHFKRYNDARGHQAGDRLLIDLAAAWQRELRPSDLLARYGGEEFAVILPDSAGLAALRVAERLRDNVPAKQTVSAGVAAWRPGEPAAELIARADAALYRAKAEGRDQAVLGDPD